MLVLLGILGAAIAIRVVAVEREPLWLDEVFSHYLSSGTVEQVLEANARDTHPPLYYLGLNATRRLVGDSVASLRGYSIAWSVAGIVGMMLLARAVSARKPVVFMAGILAAVNPLDVYFAQEARMYIQAAALGTISSVVLWAWLEGTRKGRAARGWRLRITGALYCLLTIAICYTHYSGSMILVAQGLFAGVVLMARKRAIYLGYYLLYASACVSVVLIWIAYVIDIRGVFYSASHVGWIPIPSLGDAVGFLGMEFFWGCGGDLELEAFSIAVFIGNIVAISIAFSFVFQAWSKRRRGTDAMAREQGGMPGGSLGRTYVAWLLIGTVLIAVIVSIVYQPIYYRHRFCVFVLPYFIVLSALVSDGHRRRWQRWCHFAVIAAVMATGTMVQQRAVTKWGLEEFASLWKASGPPDRAMFFPEHIRVLASYYTGEWLQKTSNEDVMDLLRDSHRSLKIWLCIKKGYEFQQPGDRQRWDWLASLGPQRSLGAVGRIEVIEVEVQEGTRHSPEYRLGERVEFGSEDASRFLGSGWYQRESTFRWSRGAEAHVEFSLAGAGPSLLRIKMFCLGSQNVSVELNRVTIGAFSCSERSAHLREVAIPPGVADAENSLTFLLPDARSPRELNGGPDTRELAIGVQWLEME